MRTMLSISVILLASACGGLPPEDGQATNNVTGAHCAWPDGDSLAVCPSLDGLEVPADYAPPMPTNAEIMAGRSALLVFPSEMDVVGTSVNVLFGPNLDDGSAPPTKVALFLAGRAIAAANVAGGSATIPVPAATYDGATLSVAFFDEQGRSWQRQRVRPVHVLYWKGQESNRSVIFTDRITRGSDNQLTFTGAVTVPYARNTVVTLDRPAALFGTLDSALPRFSGGNIGGQLQGLQYVKHTFSPAEAYEQELLRIFVTDDGANWSGAVQTEACFELDAAPGSKAVVLPCP